MNADSILPDSGNRNLLSAGEICHRLGLTVSELATNVYLAGVDPVLALDGIPYFDRRGMELIETMSSIGREPQR